MTISWHYPCKAGLSLGKGPLCPLLTLYPTTFVLQKEDVDENGDANMEGALIARDKVGVQDFVLLDSHTSEAAFLNNLRKRYQENLIYVSAAARGFGAAEMSLRWPRWSGPGGRAEYPVRI